MEIREELRYSEDHEWVLVDGDVALVGITDYAQEELGDLVFVNLPEEGDDVAVGDAFADVESVKAVSDVLSPVSGTVAAINESPYEAWFIKVENFDGLDDLMSASEYEAYVAGLE